MPSSAEVRFHPVPGFMGLPPARAAGTGAARACVVGIPFDCGTHPFRVGSRQGPDAIREQSRLLRPVDIFRPVFHKNGDPPAPGGCWLPDSGSG